MKNVFDFVDKIYCVNLPECNDRWKLVAKEFKKVGIFERVIKIYAPKPNKNHVPINFIKAGQYGCTMSHLKIIGRALKEAKGHIIIFEDDIEFSDNSEAILGDVLDALPQEWDILYLGGQPIEHITPIHKNILFKTGRMRGSYGYIINKNAILKLFNYIVDFLMDSSTNQKGIYDYILGEFSKNNNSYAIHPLIVKPVLNFSIIQGRKTINYEKIINDNWKKFGNK